MLHGGAENEDCGAENEDKDKLKRNPEKDPTAVAAYLYENYGNNFQGQYLFPRILNRDDVSKHSK